MKSHVAILGSCIIRDTFALCDHEELFVVDRFVQDANPMTICEESPLLKPINNFLYDTVIQEKPDKELPHFRKRNFVLDLTKTTIQFLTEANSEWLVLDVNCLRDSIIQFENGCISNAPSSDKVLQQLIKSGYLTNDCKWISYEKIADEDLYQRMDKFINEILRYFPQEKIILFDIEPAKFCANLDETISTFKTESRYLFARKGFLYMRSKLPNIHVVEFPLNTIGDENHRWGKGPLHYTIEYYNYAYDTIKEIVRGG